MPLSTGARSSFEQAVLDRQKQLAAQYGRKDRIITPQEIEALAAEFFGKLEAPSGVKILKQTPLEVVYETADGKQYRQFRNLSGSLGADIGRVDTDLLTSPIAAQSRAGEGDLATLLSRQLQDLNQIYGDQLKQLASGQIPAGLDSGIKSIIDRLSAPPTLGNIDPTTQAALDSINQATQAKLGQQFQDQSGQLVAQLFGQGINKSSIAGDQANRLLQGQGLVQAQAQGDAAQRQLAVQQFLGQLGQQNLALAGQFGLEGFKELQDIALKRNQQGQDLLSTLLNQLLQREVAGEQSYMDRNRFRLQEEVTREGILAQRDQIELAAQQQRQAAHRSLINSIIGGIAGFALPGVGSILSGIGGTGGGSGLPGYNSSNATGG